MELYIKESRQNYLEVIDVEYPQYIFVLDGIDYRVNTGELEVIIEKFSVVKSDQKIPDNPVEDEGKFLEEHSQLIVKELFDPVLNNTLG